MATLFDTLLVDTTKTVATSTGDLKTEKSEPSLFDSILNSTLESSKESEILTSPTLKNTSTTSVVEENISSTTTETQINSAEITNLDDSKLEQSLSELEVLTEGLSEENSVENNEKYLDNKQIMNSNNLLDRLVLNAKISSKNEKVSLLDNLSKENLVSEVKSFVDEDNLLNVETLTIPKLTANENEMSDGNQISFSIDDKTILESGTNLEDKELLSTPNQDTIEIDKIVVQKDAISVENKLDNQTSIKIKTEATPNIDIEQKQNLILESDKKEVNLQNSLINNEITNSFLEMENVVSSTIIENPENIVENSVKPKSLMDMLIEKNSLLVTTNSSKVESVETQQSDENIEILKENITPILGENKENIVQNRKDELVVDTIKSKEEKNDFNANQIVLATENKSNIILENTQNLTQNSVSINNETKKDFPLSTLESVNVAENLNSSDDLKTEIINKELNVQNNLKDDNLENVVIEESKSDDKIIEKVIKNNDVVDVLIKTQVPVDTKDIITNIYLSSQKNNLNNQILSVKKEALSTVKEANSMSDVEVGANLLDLGLENIEVEKVEDNFDNKINDVLLQDKKVNLDKLAFNKNIISEDLKQLVTKSVEASKALIEDTITKADDLTLNLNLPTTQNNISLKIVEARQHLSTMMSDIAKHMYENYKPPVTVFRINLNPLQLGSIAIMMKSEKDNGISISMSVSNESTLQALSDNQTILRNSLNKNFDDNTKFNLDFTSSNNNQNSGNSSNSNNQQSSNQNSFMNEDRVDTQTLLENRGDNLESEDRRLDYM